MNKIQEDIKRAKKTINYGKRKGDKPLLIVLMGFPGSGKSYLAEYLHQKHFFTTLSGENVAHAIFGTEKCASGQYKEVYAVLRILAKELLVKKFSIVIDGTNLKYEFRKQIYDEMGDLAKTMLFYLVIDDETALKRANLRGESYSDPKKILSKCHPETFAIFKTKLEIPQESENYFKLKSYSRLFEEIDKIIQENQ